LLTDPLFLTEDAVLLIHREQIAEFGGAQGVRDPGLLASALAQPQATFEGRFLHTSLYEKAAAYLFHIAQSQAFVDGNKRTGLVTALVFLDLNGVTVDVDSEGLYELTIAVTTGKMDKTGIAAELARRFPEGQA